MPLVAFCLALLAARGHAQPAQPSPAAGLTGRWVLAADFFGSTRYFPMHLDDKSGALTGDFDTDPLTGTVSGQTVHFLGKDPKGGTEEATGTLANGVVSGTLVIAFDGANGGPPEKPQTVPFTATRMIVRAGPPRRLEFTPTAFYREFSPKIAPVAEIAPGDTIATWTVDAGGFDQHDVARSTGGNPQTGPFFVEGAMPGDTLAVHIVKLRLNRDTALSDDGIVPRMLEPDYAQRIKYDSQRLTWHLDLAKHVATTSAPGEHLKRYTVPLHPMLGCVATAVGAGRAPPPTGDSGDFGGNMDFNEIAEGATVYLPVSVPGALLYFGDAHAAQGDGESTGDALETSMDVEVKVDLIAGHGVPGPRVETATHVMAVGLGGSIDDALRAAVTNMGGYLSDTYALTPSELAQVLGTAVELKIAEVADRNANVVVKIAKDRLKDLPLAPAKKP